METSKTLTPSSEPSLHSMRRRRCYLVRHGDVRYFSDEGKPLDPRTVSLSAPGVQQVEKLAEMLQPLPLDRAVCSDYPRARQTLDLLVAGRGLAIQETASLREIRAGRLSDIPTSEQSAEMGYAYELATRTNGQFIGGETWVAFEQRVVEQFLSLLAEPDWNNLLIASHDGVNRVLLGWAIGCGLNGLSALEQDTACVNIIDIDMLGDQVIRRLVRTVNLTPYDLTKSDGNLTVMEKIYQAYTKGQ